MTINQNLKFKKKRRDFDGDQRTINYISSDEEILNQRNVELEEKVMALTKVIEKMALKIESMDRRFSESSLKHDDSEMRKDKSSTNHKPKSKKECVSLDDYILFSKGDTNPKGGVYTLDHLTKVLLKDEELKGVVTDETQCYYRVRIDGENYPPHVDGRLKAKYLVKPQRQI